MSWKAFLKYHFLLVAWFVFCFTVGILLAAVGSALADDTVSSGLTLTYPSQGSKNWGATFKAFAAAISAHDHTGSGKGLQISTNAIATNAVTDAKIRLTNNNYLNARNAANSADLGLIKLDGSNILRFANAGANTLVDLNAQTLDAELTAIAGLVSAADRLPYFTGSGTAALATFTAFGRSLVDDADATAGRATLSAAKSGSNSDITDLTTLSTITGLTDVKTQTGATTLIHPNTSDGSDNGGIQIGMGDQTRGALIYVLGNEYVGNNGNAVLQSGDATGASVTVKTMSTTGVLNLGTQDTTRWIVDANGHLISNSSGNYDLGGASNKVRNIYQTMNTWSPTPTANAGGVISGLTTWESSYVQQGYVEFQYSAQFTLTGASTTVINIPAPVTGTTHNSNAKFICNADEGSNTVANGARWFYDGTNIEVLKPANAIWTAGTIRIHIDGRYRL